MDSSGHRGEGYKRILETYQDTLLKPIQMCVGAIVLDENLEWFFSGILEDGRHCLECSLKGFKTVRELGLEK